MAALTVSAAAVAPVVARTSATRRSTRAVKALGSKSVAGLPVMARPTKLVAGSRRAATTTASALPLAELAAVGPEIAETAVTCFAITLVGLAIGFVLLRVEAAVEGEE
mmetsp:Transcript_12905/g.58569  ORF Transcript_12905/g.58569 Transcript_12905/m.58569 type:complete len:108 (-) Transcript_12905:179-502(-)